MNELRAVTGSSYDALGRAYETYVYEVNQQDTQYPGLGRQVKVTQPDVHRQSIGEDD